MHTITRSFAPRDLVGGHPALDLVNTVTARDVSDPVDWVDGYPRLVEWAVLAGVVDADAAEKLDRLAAASPAAARSALVRAKELRESLHVAFGALIAGRSVPAAALKRVDSARKAALARTVLVHDKRVAPRLSIDDSGLDYVADTVALSAVDLFALLPNERARLCPGVQCGWLFLDTSKGGKRVWCDMATCGNAAKSERLQQRQKRRGPRRRGPR